MRQLVTWETGYPLPMSAVSIKGILLPDGPVPAVTRSVCGQH